MILTFKTNHIMAILINKKSLRVIPVKKNVFSLVFEDLQKKRRYLF
jgi:hypothetical protein